MAKLNLIESLAKLYQTLPGNRKRDVLLISPLLILNALVEIITITAIIPVLAALTSEKINSGIIYEIQSYFEGDVTVGISENATINLVFLFAILVFISSIFKYFILVKSTKVSYGIGHDLGKRLFYKVLSMPYELHTNTNSSELLAAVNKIQLVLGGVIVPIFKMIISVVTIFAIGITIIIIDPYSTIIIFSSFMVFYYALIFFLKSRLRLVSTDIADSQNLRIKSLQEGIGSIREVIIGNARNWLLSKFELNDKRYRKAQETSVILSESPRIFLEALLIIIMLIVIVFLAEREGGINAAIPFLGAFALATQRTLPQVQSLYNSWTKIISSLDSLDDVLKILFVVEREKRNCKGNKFSLEKSIELRGVCFKYQNSSESTLRNINLIINKHEKLCLAGSTGSGKSTLLDLIMGLLQPSDGTIAVDGSVISNENYTKIQCITSHVPQNIFLIDGSIVENICLSSEFDQDDLTQLHICMRAALIDDFIDINSDEIFKRVGERGALLSGGQIQRIGIARALYAQRPLLVLDEATNALDARTEKIILDNIDKLDYKPTVILISHREQAISWCDRVIKLKSGRLMS